MTRRRPPWLDEADALPVDDQAARLAAQLAEHDRRQAIKRATRADLAAARTAGLRQRHATKLARLNPDTTAAPPTPTTPAQTPDTAAHTQRRTP